ncbi:hypothetical protein ROZALSC1DRAFT_29645 [Rozella allomycis CSF55]|uniref:Vacuolar ATPase assembly integral membrane protein VMA21 n=1 Tax=Rozella allomycis (strain CSF55) TaxID=988480 RepID=A0A075B4J2_ROZAC|nr:hypothetical protein O9G_002898 [Rozella allomycis CSF55]RKP18683.1 hypothetical protein ROZALSC1DRAFT_29645 [Rozella allomycis CSF55]|eukprot:EPZ36397.1 hypothetical protein O9G_002898 [Rozella allomycis CSF55]
MSPLQKLLVFTAVLFSLPLIILYVSNKYIFTGNILYSSVASIVTVNLILFTFVYVASNEELPSANENVDGKELRAKADETSPRQKKDQ